MKMIVPRTKDIRLRENMQIQGRIYSLPYDVDWLDVSVTEEPYGWVVGATAFGLALLLAPPSLGVSLLLFYIAFRLSKRELGTIEIMFIDGFYVRGFSRNQKELRLAQRFAVGARPYIEPQESRGKKKVAPVLKLVR